MLHQSDLVLHLLYSLCELLHCLLELYNITSLSEVTAAFLDLPLLSNLSQSIERNQ